jgi:deazaflavin-dependent oxidoreductase (nitroreductase family)
MPSTYRKPDWFTQHVFNRVVAALTRAGISVAGSRVLEVPGRTSGQPRRTPVNLFERAGKHYLVSPRGETQWVRNVRAAGGRLVLIRGRSRESWQATELSLDERLPILEGYVARWKWEVGSFFGGVGPQSGDAAWRAEAAKHPAFALEKRA